MPAGFKPDGGTDERKRMNETSNFKASVLCEQTLRSQAPSIFASGPMADVSCRYTFVPTSRIVDGFPSSPTDRLSANSIAAPSRVMPFHGAHVWREWPR